MIVPTVGSNFIIRSLVEEPSGFVESKLIKSNMTISDRGMYMCRDKGQENSFGVWVTVLQSKSASK